MQSYVIYHHGIRGQKWGIRRFQNNDGSLTPAGRKRYTDTISDRKDQLKIAKKDFNKAYNTYSFFPTDKNYQDMMTSSKAMKTAKTDYKKAKIDYKVAKVESKGGFDSDKQKSRHRLALEAKYEQQGYTKKQAAVMASDRIRTEKVLTATAALTVGACAVYAANRHAKDKADQMIKSGELLQRIEMKNTDGKLNDVFYVSKGDHDNKRYEGLLGLTRKQQEGQAYLMKLEAAGDIRVASKDKASKAFGELYKNDPEFRKSAERFTMKHFSGKNKVDPDDLSNRNIRKLYENFNSNLPFMRDSSSGVDKKFYDKLKSSGYGAIQDINDMKFSGYNAKNPLIIFDNSKKNIMVKSVKELTNNRELLKKGVVEAGKGSVENMGKSILSKPYAALAATGAATTMYVSDYKKSGIGYKQAKFVEQYIKEHPNTKLTSSQIAAMYKKK